MQQKKRDGSTVAIFLQPMWPHDSNQHVCKAHWQRNGKIAAVQHTFENQYYQIVIMAKQAAAFSTAGDIEMLLQPGRREHRRRKHISQQGRRQHMCFVLPYPAGRAGRRPLRTGKETGARSGGVVDQTGGTRNDWFLPNAVPLVSSRLGARVNTVPWSRNRFFVFPPSLR